MEYVSKGSKRKDYNVSFRKYERELKVPYYLLFYPEPQELTLFRHDRTKYVSVKPNRQGRLAIRKLNLEVALLNGWVRYWYEGELLPLPADLQRDLNEAHRETAKEKERADALAQRVEAMERELADLRARLGPLVEEE